MTTRLPRRLWVDMTTREFAQLPADTVAVLPVASIEQHGPHLPVLVDACLNQGIVEHAQALLPDDLPITFLPMQAVGKANEHLAFPGTLSLSAETLTRVWTEIGEAVHRAGIRKLVIFNSHGGQPQIIDIVARDLRVRFGMFVVGCDGGSFGPVPGDPFPELERRHGIHGGSKETSMMLALRPDLVQMEHARDFRPASVDIESQYRFLRSEGRIGFGWQAQDLHPAGAAGNALDADAERGQRVIDHAAQGLATLLAEVHHYPIDHLKVVDLTTPGTRRP
ncbi:creatininase family protein [Achromobacter sp. GG226]|uniref:creatininase family protein n=1 Tax=Verticiella alkaliphila TaxID=2779529 RepID=UPI00209B733F|nr:creatininase family protein [Verticiella sp. GG226]MBU4609348.1 creatininase family protein [Verticiella sp. GG226]